MSFCMNSIILGGRKHYEILKENFEGAFPCVRTVEAKIAQYDMSREKGENNAAMLKKYLDENNMPLVVSIAEDATAIVPKREYCSRSNRVVGCSLPLGNNGIN